MKKTTIISGSKNNLTIFFLAIVLMVFSLYILFLFVKPSNDIEKALADQIEAKKDNCTCPTDNNLPIIIINTRNQKLMANSNYKNINVNGRDMITRDKSPKYQADFQLYEPDEYGYTCICGASKPTVEGEITINIRGQSSLVNPKKQYTIRFIDENNMELPVELLGMPKHDKWILNGSYGDKSLLRNYLAYKMAGQVMDYSPDTRFVEVYLNDSGDETIAFDKNYIGVYILTEKIERDENRVDIEKNEEKYNDVSFIIARDKINLGDTILQTNWNNLEDDYIIDAFGNVRMRTVITAVYPSTAKLTKTYEQKIINYLNEFEYTLRSNHFANRKKGYRKYIDIDSFANFAMINEIFKNIDGGEVSTYFYKDIGGLMKAGPVWDFDLSAGNTLDRQVNEPTGFRMINTLWYERLFQDAYFANRYRINYRRFRNTIWTTEKVHDMIDDAINELGPAIDRNRRRWYTEDDSLDYSNEITNLKEFLRIRLTWMDENIHLVKRLVENTTE